MPHVIYAPAGKKDLPRLREIFLRCFGEEAAPEMEYVFARCGDALWKAERDGIPAAMLVAMPVTIALPEGEWKARYFYGVATHPDYRKQGLCGGLLAACCPVDDRAGGSRCPFAAGQRKEPKLLPEKRLCRLQHGGNRLLPPQRRRGGGADPGRSGGI